MKPISYVHSYINIPHTDWNDLQVDIWLYNAMKSLGICNTAQNTKLVHIEDYVANIEDYETLQAVVVRENTDMSDCEELINPTLPPPYDLIFPILPYYFPNNCKSKQPTWSWAKPRKIIFAKQCKTCPTYCNDCEYVYDMDVNGNLYFPQLKTGLACVNYLTYPKLEEYMINDNNQALIDALAAYVMKNYYEVKLQIDFTQGNRYLYETYDKKWIAFKKHAQVSDMLANINMKRISNIMNNKVEKLMKTIDK